MDFIFLSMLAFITGIGTHQFYFKPYEHHIYPTRYMQAFLLLLILAPLEIDLHLGQKAKSPEFRYVFAADKYKVVASFIAGNYASLLTYRAIFHPYNKFPGPFLARISDIWYSYQCRHAHAPEQLLKLHRKYGDFLRIGSSSLSVVHPDATQAIYGFGSKCTKGLWYDNDYPFNSMHTSRSRVLHDKRRRIWSPAFSDRALRGYEDRMRPYGDKLVEQLRALGGQPINVSDWFNFFSFDVMGDLAFNKSFSMLEKGEQHWAIKLLNGGMEPLFLMLPEWLFRTLTAIPGAAGEYWKFIKYSADAVEDRMQYKPEVPDIMSALLAPYEKSGPPEGLERSYLQGDSRLVIVAGSDTTAATLTHVFYQLCANPEYIPKLREEFDPYVTADGDALNTDIQNLDLLNGVVYETLRLNPAVPSMVQRITPPEGIEIGGRHIPGDMKIWSPQYVVSRKEDIYANAESFIPERWSSRQDLLKTEGTSYAPFSLGPMGCIGKPLALMELRNAIAKLLTNFDVEFAPGEDGKRLLFETRDHFTLGMAPMKLVFKSRK